MDIHLKETYKARKKSSYHHGDLREAIIRAVATLIKERRSLDFQLRDVAKLVNTSTPAIYRHFESKQALLVGTAILGYKFQKQYRDFAIKASGDSPLQQLLAIGFAYVHFSIKCPGYFLLMKNLETPEILASETYQKLRNDTTSLVNSLIVACIEEGLFKDNNLELIAAFLQATSLGLAQLFLLDTLAYVAPKIHQDSDLVRNVYLLSLEGLLTPKGRLELHEMAKNPFENSM